MGKHIVGMTSFWETFNYHSTTHFPVLYSMVDAHTTQASSNQVDWQEVQSKVSYFAFK